MDRLVTVFGGGGFVGRYVIQEVLKAGARVRVASRDPSRSWYLKPLGGLGQIQFVAANITRAESAARAVAGSHAVINLVGILKGDFDAVHVRGAANAAQSARAAGAEAFVQVSAIGADMQAESAYGRSKGEGEAAVRAAFPGATIIRPSVLFGPEDGLVNKFAAMAQWPLLPILRAETRFQPAFAADVGRAIAMAALDPATYGGHDYELGGPQVLTMRALNTWIAEATGRHPAILAIPDEIGRLMARFGKLPGAPITWDQWLMLQQDNVVALGAEGFAAFGITPSPLAAVAPDWLVRYRRHGRFGKAPRAA